MATNNQGTLWLKSAYCGTNACVDCAWPDNEFHIRDSNNPDGIIRVSTEEGLAFFKAIATNQPDLSCLKFTRSGSGYTLQNSSQPDSPVLHFTQEEGDDFIRGVKAGRFKLA